MEGLETAPEFNGKRGLVYSFDLAKGRYQLLMEKREKPLGVRAARCKLEFAAEEERIHVHHEATQRARVEAGVRAALAAREPEPEPEPEAA